MSPTSARCSRSSRSAPPTAWWPGSAGTSPARARVRGRLRPDGGPPVPAHGPLPPLAPGPYAGVVRVRPARGAGGVRPGRHLRLVLARLAGLHALGLALHLG